MTENWYLILELEFDPNPVQDQTKIDERIDEKAKFWASKFNDYNKGPEYRKYHQMLSDIRKAMSDPEERKRMIKEACEITYEPIDKLVKTIGRKGGITDDEIRKIAGRQNVDIGLVDKRRAILGIKKEESKAAQFQAVYDKYYSTKPQKAPNFDGMKFMLKSFSVNNLYDFLFANTNIKNASNLPCDALRQRSNERKKNEFYKNDDNSGTGSKLCGQCELAFKDENSKDVYDKYLEYTKRKAILDDAKSISDISGELSTAQGDVYIGQLTEIFKDRKLATDVLVAFCKIQKIAYNPTGGSTQDTAHLKVCHCGCTNDVSDGRKICQNCGADLYIKCPKCGNVNDAHVKVCKCGFKLENINKALALCDLAEYAIDSMDFAIAQVHLTNAERYWTGSQRVKSLITHLNNRKNQVGTAAEAMRKAVVEKRFHEAEKHYQNIQKMFPDFSEPDLEKEIKFATETAGQYLKQAQAAKNEKDTIDLCSKAYEVCADYPGVKELISKYPPQAPANLKVSVDRNSRTNSLSWDKSTTVGSVFYTVVRKSNSVPVNTGDGEVLGRVSMCGFNDGKIVPAENYFYAVFAERAGVYSSALTSKAPAINLFEISDVTVAAGDSLLQLEWSTLPKGATAEIFRKSESGREEKLNTTTSVNYLDSGLSNDTPYHYIIKLAYNINGQKQLTNGVSVTGIPTKPPKAIDSLSVKPGDGDSFIATWNDADNADVELYCSTKKPEYNYGDIIAQTVLEAKMRRLALNRSSKTSATFQYKGDDLLYIVAVVIKSGSVVFGSMARASKGETVTINKIATVNEKIHIYLDVPRGATGFVVLYRFDKYPEDISDIKSIRKYIPLKQYQHYSALVIDNLEQKNYFFSVFAEFTRDGEKDYSVGLDYLFSDVSKQVITYSIAVTKKMFGESFVLLEFEAENKSFTLPDIDIMAALGNTPMFKTSAKLFYAIPSQLVTGSLQIRIPLPKGLCGDTYIKAFLKDESLAHTNQLKLKLRSSYKIS